MRAPTCAGQEKSEPRLRAERGFMQKGWEGCTNRLQGGGVRGPLHQIWLCVQLYIHVLIVKSNCNALLICFDERKDALPSFQHGDADSFSREIS